ncbi:lysine N(6)-hydroxylase/L-ornithine N(5)-oxygenase family protein [Streptomyces sp. PSAA01]|nr:SidA/IucD/PvdA family monooxygenase [Streptomyces sp. PSAA01]MCG0283822.1 lysine N(6)-hydroxylase/L-ornithine N(5)-oxygenase family protein [Streptomyces sp. PSAA01]
MRTPTEQSWSDTSSVEDEREPLDVLGVGFGPSNLALAIALTEAEGPGPHAHFYERQPRFAWHGGMLLKDATMQVHFLKDLVTLRNPVSPFSFLAYLHAHGRLVDFINQKALFPSRVEFHDYLDWTARACSEYVTYGTEVVRIEPEWVASKIEGFRVHLVRTDPSGTRREVRSARNVVLAPGLRPHLPAEAIDSQRVWHSSELLRRLHDLPRDEPSRITVVGAGQSGAEVTAYLHAGFPQAEVRSVFSQYGYAPADDSPFANRIFDPAAVDEFYGASQPVRDMLVERHANTNYSVVDQELIEQLYRAWYQEKVTGDQRLLISNVSRVVDVQECPEHLKLTIESLLTHERHEVASDYLVYATGYRPAAVDELVHPSILKFCLRDTYGQLQVNRDYSVCTEDAVSGRIYLQGATESTHGLSSTLLSNTAVRVGEIADALRSVCAG